MTLLSDISSILTLMYTYSDVNYVNIHMHIHNTSQLQHTCIYGILYIQYIYTYQYKVHIR